MFNLFGKKNIPHATVLVELLGEYYNVIDISLCNQMRKCNVNPDKAETMILCSFFVFELYGAIICGLRKKSQPPKEVKNYNLAVIKIIQDINNCTFEEANKLLFIRTKKYNDIYLDCIKIGDLTELGKNYISNNNQTSIFYGLDSLYNNFTGMINDLNRIFILDLNKRLY